MFHKGTKCAKGEFRWKFSAISAFTLIAYPFKSSSSKR
jgi:hypothetical protein